MWGWLHVSFRGHRVSSELCLCLTTGTGQLVAGLSHQRYRRLPGAIQQLEMLLRRLLRRELPMIQLAIRCVAHTLQYIHPRQTCELSWVLT